MELAYSFGHAGHLRLFVDASRGKRDLTHLARLVCEVANEVILMCDSLSEGLSAHGVENVYNAINNDR